MSAAGPQETFPWRRIMGLGLGLLRLPSAQFWAMTPKELEAAVAGITGSDVFPALSRSGMNELIQQFPDEVTNG